ncbi:AAA family ATPase [Pseudomonas sp. SJZ079]|uniref:AAA family ATPase n=1 Tax=Pseudomonas sp. SJZ079 TaxID=2572887 RepID=UPI0011BD9897|nr:AAA family ATPase [Pseudomonas sp. SJZ079]
MKLHKLRINGFKRIHAAEAQFGEATFLIGANNAGKSPVLWAIGWLLADKERIDPEFYYPEAPPVSG